MNNLNPLKIAVLLLVMIYILASCTNPTSSGISKTGTADKTEKGQYTDITVPELQAMLNNTRILQ